MEWEDFGKLFLKSGNCRNVLKVSSGGEINQLQNTIPGAFGCIRVPLFPITLHKLPEDIPKYDDNATSKKPFRSDSVAALKDMCYEARFQTLR